MITPEHESRRPSTGAGFADAVTYSFADGERGWYGLARLGLADDGASALAVLFQGAEPVSVLAQGGAPVAADAGWDELSAHGLTAVTVAALERWEVRFDGADTGFALTFTAISAPAEVAEEVARSGGMAGYEQLCAVEGTVRAGDATHTFSGLGQRGHAWGAPDWGKLTLARSVSAWLGPEHGGVTMTSVRADKAKAHDDEPLWAALVHEDGNPVEVADPRLSTTYDSDGRQRRAGVELWVNDDDAYPFRAAGEIVCGSTLDLGQLRMDLAFLRWHAEGHEGVGRYDIVRRV